MNYKALSDLLWHERDALELLVYRLEVLPHAVTRSRSDSIVRAMRDVDAALRGVHEVEASRQDQSQDLAGELGLDSRCTLADLAAHSAAPWDHIFLDHRCELLRLTGELKQLLDQSSQLVTAELAVTQSLLMSLQDPIASASNSWLKE